jgi:hypothetical protein
MNFKGEPFILDGKFFFQLVDNALADIAEGSYIVREYPHLYGHGISLSAIFGTREACRYIPQLVNCKAGNMRDVIQRKNFHQLGPAASFFSAAMTCLKA